MSKERGNGKTKKIVIGVATVVAVAAIAVPTALTLAGGKDDAGASDQNNKYNIIVSSGIENVPDYSISLDGNTKVSELKTLLKAIDGYNITGIYKDEALTEPYLEDEIITSTSKIYIGYEAITYTIIIFDENKNVVEVKNDVAHKSNLNLAVPSKPEDNFATYEFVGWADENNKLVDTTSITSDLSIHPLYKVNMKEFRIGFTNSNNTESISVTVGGEPVTLDSTYHYGSTIKLRATAKTGNEITEFKVTVGNTTVDILDYQYRVEENGVVYYEYEIAECNGNINVVYTEAVQEFTLGDIPEEVSVIRNGVALESNAKIKYGDQLVIIHDKDYEVVEFEVNGITHVSGDVWSVTGDTTIRFTGTYKYSYLTFTYNSSLGGYEVSAFDKNSRVTDIVIPATYKGQKVIGIKGNSNPSSGIFYYAEIKSVRIAEGIIKIDSSTFFGCSRLTSVSIPNSVTSIGTRAFYGCSSLTSITIPDSISSIGSDAFLGCGKLNYNIYKNANYLGNRENPYLVLVKATSTSITSCEINSSCKIIIGGAFSSCSELSSVTIESADIYKAANGTDTYNHVGGLIAKATTVKVLKTADDGSNTYLISNFTRTDDGDYWIYTKN